MINTAMAIDILQESRNLYEICKLQHLEKFT